MIIRKLLLSAVATSVASVAVAQDKIEFPGDGIDQRYQIASERFGDGRVQMHSQQEGADLMIHFVSEVDCNKRTIRSLFEGQNAPSSFPMASDAMPGDTIEPGSAEEYIAQHACTSNGMALADFVQ